VRGIPARSNLVRDAEILRVIGPLRNLDGWYAAFDIGADSKVYIPPEKRVRIW
jgi:predicted metalloendopeptidase